jgi:hypothetical protein
VRRLRVVFVVFEACSALTRVAVCKFARDYGTERPLAFVQNIADILVDPEVMRRNHCQRCYRMF